MPVKGNHSFGVSIARSRKLPAKIIEIQKVEKLYGYIF